MLASRIRGLLLINSSPGKEPKPCCCLFPKEESKLSLACVAPREENTLFLEAAEAEAGAREEGVEATSRTLASSSSACLCLGVSTSLEPDCSRPIRWPMRLSRSCCWNWRLPASCCCCWPRWDTESSKVSEGRLGSRAEAEAGLEEGNSDEEEEGWLEDSSEAAEDKLEPSEVAEVRPEPEPGLGVAWKAEPSAGSCCCLELPPKLLLPSPPELVPPRPPKLLPVKLLLPRPPKLLPPRPPKLLPPRPEKLLLLPSPPRLLLPPRLPLPSPPRLLVPSPCRLLVLAEFCLSSWRRLSSLSDSCWPPPSWESPSRGGSPATCNGATIYLVSGLVSSVTRMWGSYLHTIYTLSTLSTH